MIGHYHLALTTIIGLLTSDISASTISNMIQSVLVQKAINAALNSEWKTALELNERILEQFPQDLDSLNRLARACLELGDVARSKNIYKEVLSVDPYNVIATKNMKRFAHFKLNSDDAVARIVRTATTPRSVVNFIEEPGKTKVIPLVRLAEPQALFTLHCGDPVELLVKQRGVHAFTHNNTYIGRLPDDLAYQLHYFIKSGNKYESFVKNVQPTSVQIFVRETFRTPEFASRPTFAYISDAMNFPADSAPDGDATPDMSEDEGSMTEDQS